MARQQTYIFKPAIRGDTWDGLIITLLVNDAVKDITGSIVKMDLVKSPDSDPVKSFSTTDGEIVITNAAGGEITFATWNVDIDPGLYLYDLQWQFPGDIFKTYVKGTWAIVNDITK